MENQNSFLCIFIMRFCSDLEEMQEQIKLTMNRANSFIVTSLKKFY